MNTNAMPSDSGKLRVTIHIDSTPLLLKDAEPFQPKQSISSQTNRGAQTDKSICASVKMNSTLTMSRWKRGVQSK